MCEILNPIGSLTTIRLLLREAGCDDFQTLDELIRFSSDFDQQKKRLLETHERLINDERDALESQIANIRNQSLLAAELEECQYLKKIAGLRKVVAVLDSGNSSLFALPAYAKSFLVWSKIWIAQVSYRLRKGRSGKEFRKKMLLLTPRFDYLQSNFHQSVRDSCSHAMAQLLRKKQVVAQANNYIYGAFGEQMVVDTLRHLPAGFTVINDFSYYFEPAIYSRKLDCSIRSAQIDHVLVCPAGVFAIETKNWSEKTMQDPDMRSPVRQAERAGHALFRILNDADIQVNSTLIAHHWGKRQIPVRNILALVNQRPVGDFQFVTVLGLPEINSYIRYFKPVLTASETERIVNFLQRISTRKVASGKLSDVGGWSS